METNENKPGLGTRLSHRLAVGLAALTAALGLGLVFGGGAASAAPPTLPADPSGGAVDDTWNAVQSFVLGKGAAVLFGLTGLGILLRLALKYTKRGARAV